MEKDVIVYLCNNCIPEGVRLPRQWVQNNIHVKVITIPCSGKITTQYLFHAFEGGKHAVCVITCPKGECTLSQGNYRAQIRVENVKRLLQEIGLEPERIALSQYSPEQNPSLQDMIHNTVDAFSKIGISPVLEK